MSKDYAKNIFTHNRKAARKKRGTERYWLAGLVVVVCIALGSFLLHAHSQGQGPLFSKENFISWTQRVKTFFKHTPTVVVKKDKHGVTTQASQDQGVQFDFYTELPNMKVDKLVKEDAAAETVSASVTNPRPIKELSTSVDDAIKTAVTTDKLKPAELNKFYVQLGSFKTESDAGQFRLSLLLAGIDAEIAKVADMYQVTQGPFASNTQAKNAQHRLEKKGFSAEIKKLD